MQMIMNSLTLHSARGRQLHSCESLSKDDRTTPATRRFSLRGDISVRFLSACLPPEKAHDETHS